MAVHHIRSERDLEGLGRAVVLHAQAEDAAGQIHRADRALIVHRAAIGRPAEHGHTAGCHQIAAAARHLADHVHKHPVSQRGGGAPGEHHVCRGSIHRHAAHQKIAGAHKAGDGAAQFHLRGTVRVGAQRCGGEHAGGGIGLPLHHHICAIAQALHGAGEIRRTGIDRDARDLEAAARQLRHQSAHLRRAGHAAQGAHIHRARIDGAIGRRRRVAPDIHQLSIRQRHARRRDQG